MMVMPTETRCPSMVKLTAQNETLAEFAQPNFDVKQKVQAILQGSANVSEQLATLSTNVTLVETELKVQVSDHYEDLLSQATGVEKLERVLNAMVVKSEALQNSVERVRNRVVEPFNKMEEQTVLVSRLQATCDLLRRVIRTINISKRLQQQLSAGLTKEITKAAQSLSELDYLSKDVDLNGVAVLEKDQRFIKQARQQVEKQGETMLTHGIEAQNQTQVATALQVFYNLGNLAGTIEKILEKSSRQVRIQIEATFDVKLMSHSASESTVLKSGATPKQPGKSTMPTPGQAAAFRTTLWQNLEKLFDFVYQACARIHHLQKVLAKKRDPVTGIGFLEELSGSKISNQSLIDIFWKDVTKLLSSEFLEASQHSNFVKQSFEGEFPKLLRMCSDLWKKLNTLAEHAPSSKSDFEPEKALRMVLQPFETAYLSRSLSRLFDPVNLMFDGLSDSAPKKDEVNGCVKAIASELRVAAVDVHLCKIVAKNVAKTIKLFVVKAENLSAPSDQSATQVVDVPTATQKLNAAIVEILFYLQSQIESKAIRGIPLPAAVRGIIEESLQQIDQLTLSIVAPWMSAIGKALRSIISTLHYEDFTDDCIKKSAYIDEFEAFVNRIRSSYFVVFEECGPEFVQSLLNPIVRKTMEEFVLHVSLVRPLESATSKGGRLRLDNDFTSIEKDLALLFPGIKGLIPEYRSFLAMRTLLNMPVEELSSSALVGDALPYSVALNSLLSRAPETLRSPHQHLRMSPDVFLEFMENKSESEKLAQIRESLEAYAMETNRNHGVFSPVYELMIDLLTRAL
ncbi:unnamed protein product [Notodromas monacha]|uniref:Conserved oligomeric Golgi complex subunit 5 n=1 Tax=Notodromas monacha TaxID=399045 RepID=A0A7R9GAT0_9CRUS|nr:unnamed protein product [Notodromas monacha]CAG0914063.1 unnamed protein product [Notodromas monacha]